MEFQKLELKPTGNWVKRLMTSHTKKTIVYIVIGAIAGFAFYYITEGRFLMNMQSDHIIKNTLMGAFVGFYITNSPCARGKC